jgi:dTDP-4-amino-4,6-dideoxygalactose transaminase
MKVPLLDLKAQYAELRGEIEPVIREVFESQYFIGGPKVESCEKAIADYCRTSCACGTASGTDALLVSLMAENIGPGDEVITTPYTFFATAGCITRTGARPVFADIDPVSFNIRPDLIEAKITPRTKAVIPVHLYGQIAEMDPIMAVAEKHGLIVIEDACQAIGAEYKGRRAGSIGHYGCFSFFPSKNLGGAGDGGMVVTQDTSKGAHLKILRNHGMYPKYYHSHIGGNFRLDALQAAVVEIKLRHLDRWSEQRQRNAERYTRLLQECSIPGLIYPTVLEKRRHIFNQYIIRVPRRDELRTFLLENGVGVEIYYPVPLHLQECFASLGYREGDFPESEKAAAETLALPIYPEVTNEQSAYVVEQIRKFYSS